MSIQTRSGLNDFLHPSITLFLEKIIPLLKLFGLVHNNEKVYIHILNIIIIHDLWIRENEAIALNIEQYRLYRKLLVFWIINCIHILVKLMGNHGV